MYSLVGCVNIYLRTLMLTSKISMGLDLNYWSINMGMRLQLVIAVMVVCTSCGQRDVFLDSGELKLIDSLYVEDRKIWQMRLSDSCIYLRDLHFENLIDSLIEERLFEVREMIKSYE